MILVARKHSTPREVQHISLLNQPLCKQQKSANDPTTSMALKPNQWKQYSLLNKGFSSTIIKLREELRLERELRQQRKEDEEEQARTSAREEAQSDSSLSSDYDKKPAAKPTSEALLALPSSDFRIDRCHLMKDLLDAAETDEKTCQAADDLLHKSAKCKDRQNLEDHGGMYRCLGKNLSKTSSQDAINNAIHDIKTEWRNSALRTHSDKTADLQKHEEFLEAKALYHHKKKAFFLGEKDDELGGYAARVCYNKEESN